MQGQMSFFDGANPFVIDRPVRLIELFAGIGAQAKAVERLGIEHELYRVSEWDVFANCSYRAIHCKDDTTDYSAGVSLEDVTEALIKAGLSSDGKTPLAPEQIKAKPEKWRRGVYSNLKATRNIGSITRAAAADLAIVDTDKYIYLVTYSFPCQDLSLAGNRRGMERGSGTRSGLLWEFERILKSCTERPQVLLMENVPEVCRGKNAAAFADWLSTLESLGYRNYYKIQNAVDYGVPQNRERCFMISLLGDYYYTFPEPAPLETCALDYLEERVPDRYYLTADDLETKLTYTYKDAKTVSGGGFVKTLKARDTNGPACVLSPFVYAPGNCRVINTKNGLILPGGRMTLKVYAQLLRPYKAAGPRQKSLSASKRIQPAGIPILPSGGGICDLSYPNSTTRRGRIQRGGLVSPTLTTGNTGICAVRFERSGE